MLPLQMPLERTPLRLKVRRSRATLMAADEIHHDLRGCDDGATVVASVQRPRQMRSKTQRAQMQRVPAPVSMHDATRVLERPRKRCPMQRLVRRLARRAHHRRILVARARAPRNCLLPWVQAGSRLFSSALQALVYPFAHIAACSTPAHVEQSASGGGEDTPGEGSGDRAIGHLAI